MIKTLFHSASAFRLNVGISSNYFLNIKAKFLCILKYGYYMNMSFFFIRIRDDLISHIPITEYLNNFKIYYFKCHFEKKIQAYTYFSI